MKIVRDSKENATAISKYGRPIKSSDGRVQREYQSFKKLYKEKFDDFYMHYDSYNTYGKKSWVFRASLKSNSFSAGV